MTQHLKLTQISLEVCWVLSLLWETLLHMLLFAVLISISKFGLLHILESSRVCHPLTVSTAAPLMQPPFNMTVIVYQFLPLKPDHVSPAPNPPIDSCLLRINAKTLLHSTKPYVIWPPLVSSPHFLPLFPLETAVLLNIIQTAFASAFPLPVASSPGCCSSLPDFRGPSWISAHSTPSIIIILTHPILFWPKHLSPLNIKWGAFTYLFPVCQAPLDYKLHEGLHFAYIAHYCITNAWNSMEATPNICWWRHEWMHKGWIVSILWNMLSLRCLQTHRVGRKKCKCRV